MSGDEDTDEIPLYRRNFFRLLGGTIVLGTLVSMVDEEPPDFSSEVSELQNLAQTIDSTDLRDPQNNSMLQSSIATTIESVNSSLSEKEIEPTGKTPSSTPAVGASNINQALEYYQELQQTLDEGESLSGKIESREINTLNSEYFNGQSNQDRNLPNVESSISKFSKTVATHTRSEWPPSTQKLLPDLDRVSSRLNRQRAIYKKHADMQERFLKVILSLNSGIDAFERSSFDSAGRNFQRANNKASVQISDSLKDYKVTSYSLSLGNYSQIFRLYRQAASNMAAACAEGMSREERNQKIDLGIKKQFKARDIFAGGVSF
ncbi:hypothetical protein [Haloarcula argentinensis]|uniref:hypothetical protein n=1 Tax=Haloarcula argentinensis TaxID=43776 RepID=UPI0012692253|nr:hypothetical protein [Haloarcula argentinensis]